MYLLNGFNRSLRLWRAVLCDPVNRGEKLHAVGRLKPFDQSAHLLQATDGVRLIGKEIVGLLRGSFEQINFHVRLLAVAIAACKVPLDPLQILFQIGRMGALMTRLISQP